MCLSFSTFRCRSTRSSSTDIDTSESKPWIFLYPLVHQGRANWRSRKVSRSNGKDSAKTRTHSSTRLKSVRGTSGRNWTGRLPAPANARGSGAPRPRCRRRLRPGADLYPQCDWRDGTRRGGYRDRSQPVAVAQRRKDCRDAVCSYGGRESLCPAVHRAFFRSCLRARRASSHALHRGRVSKRRAFSQAGWCDLHLGLCTRRLLPEKLERARPVYSGNIPQADFRASATMDAGHLSLSAGMAEPPRDPTSLRQRSHLYDEECAPQCPRLLDPALRTPTSLQRGLTLVL